MTEDLTFCTAEEQLQVRGSEKAWQVQGVFQLGFSEGKDTRAYLTGMIVEQCIFTQCSMAAAKHIHSIQETFHIHREAKNGALSSNLTDKPKSKRRSRAQLREGYLAADRVHLRKGLTKQVLRKDKPSSHAVTD